MPKTIDSGAEPTKLQPRERGDLSTALTSEQKAHLLKHDYVWVKGVGVFWKPPDGALRRARFTHGTYFRTQRGEFYIDSEGSARELSDRGLGDAAIPGPAMVSTTRFPVSTPDRACSSTTGTSRPTS